LKLASDLLGGSRNNRRGLPIVCRDGISRRLLRGLPIVCRDGISGRLLRGGLQGLKLASDLLVDNRRGLPIVCRDGISRRLLRGGLQRQKPAQCLKIAVGGGLQRLKLALALHQLVLTDIQRHLATDQVFVMLKQLVADLVYLLSQLV